MTGYTGSHGGGSSQPTTTSRPGRPRPERTCPYSSTGWFWLQAWARPSHQLTQHSKCCLWPQFPFAFPWSLAASTRGSHSTTWVAVARAVLPAGSYGGSGLFRASTPVQCDQWQGPRHVSGIHYVRMIAPHGELREQPSRKGQDQLLASVCDPSHGMPSGKFSGTEHSLHSGPLLAVASSGTFLQCERGGCLALTPTTFHS